MIKLKALLIIVFLMPLRLLGENDPFEKRIDVVVVAKHNHNTVWLRWAPTSPSAWEVANSAGWWVERILIPTDNLPGDTTYQLLTKNPVKPLPLNYWEQPSDTCDFAAIAAQVLYGETLEVIDQNSAMYLIDKNRELESRFAFGLAAAEQSFKVAQMMGLGIVDSSVESGRTYVYRVFANVTDSLTKVDTVGIVVNLKQRYELPKIFDLTANVRDTTVFLRWPAGYHKGIYSSYQIDKRTESGNFASVSDLPLVNMFDGGADDFYHSYNDCHTIDGETLFYRIRGKTPFGDFGPSSDSVKVVIPLHFPTPESLNYYELTEGNIGVTWEFAEEYISKVNVFEIIGSQSYSGTPVLLGKYSASERGAVIKPQLSEMFIAVVAVGADGSRRNSPPIMIQLADSIPPLPPVNISGVIDMQGVAKVKWTWGTEPDLLGYRVYEATSNDEEFNLVSKDFVRDSVFQWNVPLNNLTKKRYVKLMAYDFRFNYSEFSKTITLTVPDTIPPSAPILKQCYRNIKGVHFSWIQSSSSDVRNHALISQSITDFAIDTISVFAGNETNFLWEDLKDGNFNFYVVAVDSSDNWTRSIQNFQLNLIGYNFSKISPKVLFDKDIAKGQIDLRWSGHEDAKLAILYRSVNDEPARIYKTLTTNRFADKDVAVGLKYKYFIRLQSKEGLHSQFSNEVIIVF